MKGCTTLGRAILLLGGALAAVSSSVIAAESGDTALATQTQQMEALATPRGEGAVSGKISSDFSAFAGSRENSDALVTGLRNGTSITLTSIDAKGATTSATFTPPTGKMGYGNVYTSLALAKQQLARAGITDPTAAQIEAALTGGTVTAPNGQTTTMTGVLELRAQGMGWGQIAHQYGYKLGPVISGMKSSNASLSASRAPTSGSVTTATSGRSNSGVVTAGGTTGGSHGQGHAYGRGIVTGSGTGVAGAHGNGHGNAYGRGIVTGGGTMGAQAGAKSAGHGKALGKGN